MICGFLLILQWGGANTCSPAGGREGNPRIVPPHPYAVNSLDLPQRKSLKDGPPSEHIMTIAAVQEAAPEGFSAYTNAHKLKGEGVCPSFLLVTLTASGNL